MIRAATLAALALLAAACAPQAPVDPDTPIQSADATACAARGGTMRQVGRLQSWQCVVTYADAGKVCTDGDQCQGDCWVEASTRAGDRAVGRCQPTSDRFGCHTPVEDGKMGAGLCID